MDVYEIQSVLKDIEPKNNTYWFHYKGGTYKVLLKAMNANDPNEIKVIYQNNALGHIWELSLKEWMEEITLHDGRVVKRFSPWLEEYSNLEEQWDS